MYEKKILQERTEKGTNFLSFMGSAVLVKLHLMQNQQNWYLLYLILMYMRVLQYSYKILSLTCDIAVFGNNLIKYELQWSLFSRQPCWQGIKFLCCVGMQCDVLDTWATLLRWSAKRQAAWFICWRWPIREISVLVGNVRYMIVW